MGSFTPVQGNASSEDILVVTDNMDGNKIETNIILSSLESHKSTEETKQRSISTSTLDSKQFEFHNLKINPVNVHPTGSPGSPSLSIYNSPILSERSNSSDMKSQSAASPSMESSLSPSEFDSTPDLKLPYQVLSSTNTLSAINPRLILDVEESGYGGGPCSIGATTILDFMAEVLYDQIKGTPVIKSLLEIVPLYVDAESVLVFQGLCLTRLMRFVERRLLRDDEEDDKKLDKNCWSLNLEALCYMIVDRVYMGSFPQPAAVLKTLEFLLSMLQLANKDGRIEQALPAGKGILSIGRGTKQLDAYVHAIFKNLNRITMYCFLPSFLISIGEDEFLSRLGLQIEPRKKIFTNTSEEDERPNAWNLAVHILKHLLVHHKAALEDLLVSKPNQGPILDVLHGGFDLLLTGTQSTFFDWLHMFDLLVNRTLEQCAAIMWVQYVDGSVKFSGVRTKGMDSRRKKEISRESRDSMKLDQRHWEQVNERRIALELVRDAMSSKLRVVRQDKSVSNEEPEWQLCPIEGPYRMYKKLERCKLKVDTVQTILDGKFEFEEASKEKTENNLSDSNAGSDADPLSNLLLSNVKHESLNGELFDESIFKDSDGVYDAASIKVGWNKNNNNNNDRDMDSSINDESLHSAAKFSMKSSSTTAPFSESIQEKFVISSPKKSTSTRFDEVRAIEDKLDKELSNNVEYLIRPYLLPPEKIKIRYNCERVVGLDKHDVIFLIGELCLYVIENFYIDQSGCICEKETEDELLVIDQALCVIRDFSMRMDSQSKLTSSWGTAAKAYTGGRA
ncbi:SPIRRIG protein isoform X2 [Tanacetum coccineum]|uniref:SPIRRIG protein isoform X2 n=1 Tax=Tanacetum coccineum TaxID=301880 RepID=A0ABQ5I4V4_9ASTR